MILKINKFYPIPCSFHVNGVLKNDPAAATISFGSFATSKPLEPITSSPAKSIDPGLIISLIAEHVGLQHLQFFLQ